MELRNRFHGIDSASQCCLAGRYDNPIPTRFLAPMAYSKIPALDTSGAGSTIIVTSSRKDFVFILCKIANFNSLDTVPWTPSSEWSSNCFLQLRQGQLVQKLLICCNASKLFCCFDYNNYTVQLNINLPFFLLRPQRLSGMPRSLSKPPGLTTRYILKLSKYCTVLQGVQSKIMLVLFSFSKCPIQGDTAVPSRVSLKNSVSTVPFF